MSLDHDDAEAGRLTLARIEERVAGLENKFLTSLRPISRRLRDLESRSLLLCPTPNPGAFMQERALAIGRLLQPQSAIGVSKARFGARHDGGYVQLDHFDGVGSALSLGIGDDVSWDLDIAARGLAVWQFDGTVDGPPATHDNFRFAKLQVGGSTQDGQISLQDAILKASEGCERIIVKMDIEGHEWEALLSTPDEVLARCSQIVCELHAFHDLTLDHYYTTVRKTLEKMAALFGVVHVHSNNFGSIIALGNVPFFQTLEISFANRRDFQLGACEEVFPTPLDAPNNPAAPDHFLGTFNFGARPPAKA